MQRGGVDRRQFGVAMTGALVGSTLRAGVVPAAAGSLTDVVGLKVGHFTDLRRPTGCTVVLAEEGAVCGVDVRGGAPGTRETDLLGPVNNVQQIHAVVLSGGSAFGLDTATGVTRYLEERGVGFPVGPARVPIVPAAILFDLGVGDWTIRPDSGSGYAAARAARTGPVTEGNVGAGAGATVGKLLGPARAMKGGLGSASVRLPNGIVVAALVAVNAVGDVVDPATGRLVAGARSADGHRLEGAMQTLLEGQATGLSDPRGGENTTLGVVATNAVLSKVEATKVAQMAHDGLARTVNPVHTPLDGDTIFCLSTGKGGGVGPALIGPLAAEVMARAVLRAVWAARGLPGLPAAIDMQ